MILRIDARGPGSDQISYKIGNHPGRQLIRRESEALGRLWFPEYEDEKCSVILHVRSNIPPIPNRLTSSSIRYREWHRFAEWVNSFLGKVLREPEPGGQEDIEYRVKVGVLPEPIKYEEELSDLFERVDLSVEEPSGRSDALDRWLRLRANDLSFSGVLRRLAVLVPALFGSHRSGLDTKGYAGLLEKLRGTWFNVHPRKEFLSNRFLSLRESARTTSDESAVSVREDQKRFKQLRELYEGIGQTISDLIEIPWTSEEQELWVVNVRDGMVLPGLNDLMSEFTTHLVDGHQKDLNRAGQRLKRRSREDDVQQMDEERMHWSPAGFQEPDLSGANIILWSPMASELNEDMISEVAHEMLSIHGPERLVVWGFSRAGSIVAPESIPVKPGEAVSGVDQANWTKIWEQKAEEEGYSFHWKEDDARTIPGDANGVHLGRFTG